MGDPGIGILVDKHNVINYQLVIRHRLLSRFLTNQPNVERRNGDDPIMDEGQLLLEDMDRWLDR